MIERWLERLEDPFETFSLRSVVRALSGLVKEAETRRLDRMGPYGVSCKYYTVEDEHDIEVVEHLIGSALVLAQATITQAVSLTKRMHEEAGKPNWIPSLRAEILKTAAPCHAGTGLSKIVVVDAAANYYKHHSEWKDNDWAGPPYSNRTITVVAQLGLGPKGYHQLDGAIRELEVFPDGMEGRADLVVRWRLALAAHVRAEGRKIGISIASNSFEPGDVEVEGSQAD